ncbi:MAG TPA: hypothetical protein VFN21_08400 [Acidimicrobiales bacterium]|nr:hypothetical protein [Acidimicrobiales bacterium]
MSVIGVATAVTTTAAAWAPITSASPASDTNDNAQNQRAGEAADGTYESCAAYFGLGKYDGSLDIVEFDVADTDASSEDGVAHAVPSDTQVVLVLTNEAGDTLECTPVEVTETMWNDAMEGLDLNMLGISPEHPLPSWPGPGHYLYPSVNFEPYIGGSELERADDFGYVTAVGFKVTAIPDGHTLVSPTEVHPLDVHYPGAGEGSTTVEDPLLTKHLTTNVGAAAAAAFSAALVSCGPDGDGSPDFGNANLIAAIRALEVYRDYSPEDVEYLDCGDVAQLNGEVSFQLDLTDTVNYVEHIWLSLPPTPTTTPATTTPATTTPATTAPPTTTPPTAPPTTTPPTTAPPSTTVPPTTTPPLTSTSTTAPPVVAPQSVAAEPVRATPAYTG